MTIDTSGSGFGDNMRSDLQARDCTVAPRCCEQPLRILNAHMRRQRPQFRFFFESEVRQTAVVEQLLATCTTAQTDRVAAQYSVDWEPVYTRIAGISDNCGIRILKFPPVLSRATDFDLRGNRLQNSRRLYRSELQASAIHSHPDLAAD